MKRIILSTRTAITACLLLITFSSIIANKIDNKSRYLFTENKGQIINSSKEKENTILFEANTSNYKIFLRKTGISYVADQIIYPIGEKKIDIANQYDIDTEPTFPLGSEIKVHRIDLDFIGANLNSFSDGQIEQKGNSNYYLAHCPKGVLGVKSFSKVYYSNIYKNIDLECSITQQGQFKYNLIVNPGGDLNDIKMKYSGAKAVEIIEGKIHITTSIGHFTDEIPEIYYLNNNNKENVSGSYKLENGIISFNIENYNSTKKLIIDPMVSYFGGGSLGPAGGIGSGGGASVSTSSDGNDFGKGIAIGLNGDIHIVGNTFSLNFPVTVGAFQVLLQEFLIAGVIFPGTNFYGDNAFTTAFDKDWNIKWSTYYGGGWGQKGRGIDVDFDGNVVITGETESPDLPTLNAHQDTFAGSDKNIFVAHFDQFGALNWATYMGDTKATAYDVVFDSKGNSYIVGEARAKATGSNVWTTGPAPLSSKSSVIVKYNPNGVRVWGRLLPGSNSNQVLLGIDVDSNDDLVMSGWTNSPDFIAFGSFRSTNPAGDFIATITKMDTNATVLWSTYYGGTTGEVAHDVAFDENDNVYAVGQAQSSDFPTLNAFQPAKSGMASVRDGFIIKFNSNGDRKWATFYGDADEDLFRAVTINKGNVYVLGQASALHTTVCGYQSSYGGDQNTIFGMGDLIFTRFDTLGNHFCDSFLGGPGNEKISASGGIAYNNNNIYICAITQDGLTTTANAITPTFQGGGTAIPVGGLAGEFATDVLLAEFCAHSCGPNEVVTNFDTSSCLINAIAFENTTAVCDTNDATFTWEFTSGTPATSTLYTPPTVNYVADGNYKVVLNFSSPCSSGSITKYVNSTSVSCVILAEDRIEFSALKKYAEVELRWDVQNLSNIDYFTIERSTNKVDFEYFKTIKKEDENSYIEWDRNPHIGVSYYRIKTENEDGSSTYSEIRKISIIGSQFVNLYPNPAAGIINLEISTDKNEILNIRIMNTIGQQVMSQSNKIKKGKSTTSYDVNDLPAGAYFVEVNTSNSTIRKKLILN